MKKTVIYWASALITLWAFFHIIDILFDVLLQARI
jgi:hypothetical protein